MNRFMSCEKPEKGTSLMEFAIFLPFLLFLLTGVVEGGRIFTHLTWVSQLAFQTAMAGVDDRDARVSEEAMRTRYQTLFGAQSARMNLLGETANLDPEVNGTDRLVTVRLNGEMKILNNFVPPMGFSVSVTVPQLVDRGALMVNQAAADGFANPAQIYLCNQGSVGFGDSGSCNAKICNGANGGSARCYCRVGSNVISCTL